MTQSLSLLSATTPTTLRLMLVARGLSIGISPDLERHRGVGCGGDPNRSTRPSSQGGVEAFAGRTVAASQQHPVHVPQCFCRRAGLGRGLSEVQLKERDEEPIEATDGEEWIARKSDRRSWG